MTIEEIKKAAERTSNLEAMTGNERLFESGLLEEFERCKVSDREKATFILEILDFDTSSIKEILSQ